MLSVGDRAPDMELASTAGREVRLSELFGGHQATVLAFYVLDFTPG